jgi:glycerol kinase
MRHVIAIDQGTTGSTVLILDETLRLVGRGYREFAQHYPEPGWVEHDPNEIWASCSTRWPRRWARPRCPGVDRGDRHHQPARDDGGVGPQDRQPVHRAIVWQDRRTADAAPSSRPRATRPTCARAPGLTLDPYFSGTKLAWLLRNDRSPRPRTTASWPSAPIDSYLLWRLTGGAVHATDVTNASRTLLFDLHTRGWSPSCARCSASSPSLLPTVVPSAGVVGTTRGVPGLLDGVPIAAWPAISRRRCSARRASSPAGQVHLRHRRLHLDEHRRATGDVAPRPVDHGGLADPRRVLAYALEGSAFIAGAAVQWLRDGLGFFSSAKEVEALAASVPDSGGVVVVPAFTGLGAPHWRPDARGLITGLTRGTTRAHLARATLEGIALQNVDILRAMEADSMRHLTTLRVDGGAAANDLLMQFQSDVLGVEISRPALVETTALGAAFLAGLGAGVWQDKAEIVRTWREERRFTPTAERATVDAHLARWAAAVAKA